MTASVELKRLVAAVAPLFADAHDSLCDVMRNARFGNPLPDARI